MNFHKNRYEWVFQAKQEFIDRFGCPGADQLDVNEQSFSRLMKFYKDAEAASRLALEQHEEKTKEYEELIERNKALLDQEISEAEQQYQEICSKINVHDLLLSKIELKSTEPGYIHEIVHEVIPYTPNHRKASVINRAIENLEQRIAEELEPKLREILQEADRIKIGSENLSHLPYITPIPRLEQKIDSFWLKSNYEKAASHTRELAHEWVTAMYHTYNEVLAPIENEARERKEELSKEANALKSATLEKRKKLKEDLAVYEQRKAELEESYQKVYDSWKQYREHASQLVGHFIKHWMDYKNELEQFLHNGSTEERWLASKYLELLLQDGEKIITI
ncbi:hypothetical protein [Neobacillus muris]|uniref:hypothetical protein n=1 Tax=Neobacillus muris TaxID=2941334 RepID=UPI00203F0641|nr:hypothetical protein [Neobacillus muris]